MFNEILIGVCLIAIIFLLIIAIISLARIGKQLHIIAQVISIGIQRSGLVRTPEQARADAETASREEEEETIPFHEIPEEE